MRRRGMLVVAVCVAILAGILPIVASIYLSNLRATEAEREHLAEYANWTLQRTQQNLTQAFDALAVMDKEGWHDCSTAHIARMRQLATDTASVEEISYVSEGRLLCSSWGRALTRPLVGTPRRTLEGGYGIELDVDASLAQAGKMMSITRGSHSALVKPERLVDVLRDTNMSLGVAFEQGELIALSGSVDPGLIARLTLEPVAGVDDKHVFASVASAGLTTFAVSERADMQDRIRHELWVLVPIGLVAAALLVGSVFWISRQRLSIQSEIARGIRKREFVAYYQPIMSLSTGRCVGAEALVRWQRPDGAVIMPNSFVPIAEDLGLLSGITDQIISRVVEDLAGMLKTDADIHVAINICAHDVETGRFFPALDQALRRHAVSPSQVWLEATERGFINADAARQTLLKARADGHRVSIDDFGTGYSSLSLLEQLPLDALKIDKSFVDSIGKGAATSVVTAHIVEMAKELKLTIIAEGIETPEQEQYLRGAGVDFGQGWLYAKAMPVDEFVAFFKANQLRINERPR